MKMLRITLIFFLLPLTALEAVVIRLNENASVCGAMVELGEIADIQTDNPLEKERISRLRLFPLPKDETIFQADVLKELLSKKIGREFVFIGSEVCVNPFYTRILQAEIVEKIKSSVRKSYQAVSFDDLKVVFLDPLESVKVPYGDIDVDVAIPVGKFSLPKVARIQVKLDGELYFSKMVRVRLLAYMNVLVARKNLKKNERISGENTLLVKKIINDQPEQYLTRNERQSVMGMKLKSRVKKGDPILINRILSYQFSPRR